MHTQQNGNLSMTDHPERLQMTPDEMRTLGYQAIDMIVDHITTLPDQPAITLADRATMESRLREAIPQQPTDMQDLFAQFQRDIVSDLYRKGHPRDFAFVPNVNNFASVLADVLTSGFNVFAGAWVASPGAAMTELVTIDWLRQIFGLPEGAGGLFVSGGSMANLTGLAAARHIKLDDRIDGATVYMSDQTHASLPKNLRVLGFQPEQIRTLPSDDDLRLSIDTLQAALAHDRAAGLRPFCVVASAGTTNTGAVDPLPQLADLCAAQDLWLHVDGAYGAGAILSEKGRAALQGIERVDSLAFDPHKWLFQSLEIGCTLMKDARHLRETFAVHAEYLRDLDDPADEEINYYDYGVQMTRSFRALKVWLSLKAFGLEAFRAAVTRGIELAEIAELDLRESPCWDIITPAQLGVVTFRYVVPNVSDKTLDALNQRISQDMIASGYAIVFTTTLYGKTVLRMTTISPHTTDDDVHETIRRLTALGVAAAEDMLQ